MRRARPATVPIARHTRRLPGTSPTTAPTPAPMATGFDLTTRLSRFVFIPMPRSCWLRRRPVWIRTCEPMVSFGPLARKKPHSVGASSNSKPNSKARHNVQERPGLSPAQRKDVAKRQHELARLLSDEDMTQEAIGQVLGVARQRVSEERPH